MKYDRMEFNDIIRKYGYATLIKYRNLGVFAYYKQDGNLNNKGLSISVMAYETDDVLPEEIYLQDLMDNVEQIEINNTIIY